MFNKLIKMKTEVYNYPFAEYFKYYIELVKEEDMFEAFNNNLNKVQALFKDMSDDKGLYAYAEGKWTIKELLLHIIDTERIFNFRALSFARNEKQNLPGFDHDSYVKNSNANSRILNDLLQEFISVRKATITLFKGFSEEMLKKSGKANGNELTVLAIGFLIVGHCEHHLKVLKEKYLS